MTTIGRKIQILREDRQLARKDVAKAIGVKKDDIKAYENSFEIPTPEVLEKLSYFFGVDIAALACLPTLERQAEKESEDIALKDLIEIANSMGCDLIIKFERREK